MHAKREATIWGLEAGITAGLALGFLAGIAAAGGHGIYLPAVILFPYAMLSATVLFSEGITFPFLLIGLAQYPIYGILIARQHVCLRKIAIVHGCVVIFNLTGCLIQKFLGSDAFPLV